MNTLSHQATPTRAIRMRQSALVTRRWPRCLCALAVLLVPAFAHAEGFLDFAIGGAFTQNGEATIAVGGTKAAGRVEYDDSFSGGVRGGYWFEQLPWLGVGGMVSYFEPDLQPAGLSGYDNRRFDVVPLTALLMLRAPLLPSERVPRGQLQPYLQVGPGAFITAINDGNHHYHDRYNHNDQTSVDVGVDLHAGATWMLTSRFGMFGEYRFTHYDLNLDGDSDYNGDRISIDSTLDTHHVMAGFAWHFD